LLQPIVIMYSNGYHEQAHAHTHSYIMLGGTESIEPLKGSYDGAVFFLLSELVSRGGFTFMSRKNEQLTSYSGFNIEFPWHTLLK
jgi:hypothetical protein